MRRAIFSLLLCFALIVGLSLAQGPGNQGAITSIRSRLTLPNGAGLLGIFLNQNDTYLYKCIAGSCGLAGAQIVFNGSQALATSLIGSGTCATTIQVANGNIRANDRLFANLSGDPTATTGYAPTATGGLNVFTWLSAGNVNIAVCNNTGAGITPGAVTLNLSVLRVQ